MKRIKLSQEIYTLVNSSDAERIMDMSWWANFNGYHWYAVSSYYENKSNRGTVYMHRFILNAPKGLQVDHINGNTLDNRRSNLRLCTNMQNSWNRGAEITSTSGYKGVYWAADKNRWRTRIMVNKTNIHIGYFDDVENAARAYDDAAIKYHGEFARTNF